MPVSLSFTSVIHSLPPGMAACQPPPSTHRCLKAPVISLGGLLPYCLIAPSEPWRRGRSQGCGAGVGKQAEEETVRPRAGRGGSEPLQEAASPIILTTPILKYLPCTRACPRLTCAPSKSCYSPCEPVPVLLFHKGGKQSSAIK